MCGTDNTGDMVNKQEGCSKGWISERRECLKRFIYGYCYYSEEILKYHSCLHLINVFH